MESFIGLVIFVCAAIGYYKLYTAIFIIRDASVKQAEFLKTQQELLVHQNGILVAQLSLLASLADKAGVPVKDINEVTTDYEIEFE